MERSRDVENQHLYGLLVGIGNYEKVNIQNLPTYKADLSMLGTAIVAGLKCPQEHVRFLAGDNNDGTVKTRDLAKAIKGFKELLSEEDTLIFYFSGHGLDERLIFSDGQVELQSVIDYIENLPTKNKLVILDCCHAGDFEAKAPQRFSFTDSVESFAEHGIAVIASTSGTEQARLGPDGKCSMFSGALATAIVTNKRKHNGQVDLNDICAETRRLVNAWNKQNPDKAQTPIFRSSVGGTIFFPVEEYKPYEPMEFSAETEMYMIDRVEPLSSQIEKRLSAFVILKQEFSNDSIAEITKEIAERVKYAEIYSSERSELRFEGTPAEAVWCYFGYDDNDMVNHLHVAYSIWAVPNVRNKYYRENKNSEIIDDIYIWMNPDYKLLRKMQESTVTRDEFILQNKKFLSVFINMAGAFIVDMQAVANQEKEIEDIQHEYGEWIELVRSRYINLSDLDVPPIDLHDWSEEITNLAGCVLDLSLMLKGDKETHMITGREKWLIDNSVRRYNESLSRLADIEKQLKF